MKIKIFAVLDTKTGIYSHPMFMHTTGAMMRAWVDTVNDPKSSMNKHPEDYVLFELGEYDDAHGRFLNNEAPVSLGVAAEVVRNQTNVV